ncbi:hypothetical protein Fmac_001660 [Flemingia macrophylla]|uniref:Demeter RRM-fold domain-containing protein n=1 Tax=Flemingia macrophylla TaxID=520843 RepID=A0ABD1NKK9_9FABA
MSESGSIVYRRRAKPNNEESNMKNNKVEKQDSWEPTTPTKPILTRKHIENVVEADGVKSSSPSSSKKRKSNGEIDDELLKGTPRKTHEIDDGVDFGSSSMRKRKNMEEIDDELPKGTPKKIYRPKVVSQISKSRTKGNAPKLSTPKKRQSYVRRGPRKKRLLGQNELGDRRFLLWKGSVLDSVVGVFLTQNVSDYLSSSTFMTLAAKFPVEKQESIGNDPIFTYPKFGEKEKEENKHEEMEAQKNKDSSKFDDKGTQKADPLNMHFGEEKLLEKKNKNKEEKEKLMEEKKQYWDTLRKMYTKSPRDSDHMDSVDWQAVRCAQASEVAKTIASRGQHNIIGGRIQCFLNNLMDSTGTMDLEWLRDAPPKEVKEYLLTIHGLGLKSVECVRLLALRHSAFPVDINVARIVVRLGWVPLQPLPEYIQLHNLEIEKLALPESTWDQPMVPKFALPESTSGQPMAVTPNLGLPESTFIAEVKNCEPIIEFPASPEHENTTLDEFEVENDEEFLNYDCEDIEDIPTIKLNSEETHNYSLEESENDINKSTSLVVLHPDAANIPVPKMKNVSRLKTERLVYVLPDEHPLLVECTPREKDDPSPYLLVIWTTGELESSCEPTKNNLSMEENSVMVPGTLLIPCRTAMRGRFPLNGTYFQVNEVFVDYASMIQPINVPRKWLWKLEKRIVYFGTGISSIMRGLCMQQIQYCFWKGFVCVRAFDAKTRAPRPISSILHRSTTAKIGKNNKKVPVDDEE